MKKRLISTLHISQQENCVSILIGELRNNHFTQLLYKNHAHLTKIIDTTAAHLKRWLLSVFLC